MSHAQQINPAPVDLITSSIESEEWGDVRSYLDEFDSVIHADAKQMDIISNALAKKSHLVVFTRAKDNDWYYEEL